MTARAETADRIKPLPVPWAIPDLPSEQLALFTSDEKPIVHGWRVLTAFAGTRSSHRPFLTKSDLVFISYVWADGEAIENAQKLSDTLTKLGIRHFLDRRHVGNGFVGWRSHVASALEQATHVAMIASSHTSSGRIMLREMRTVVQRWHFDQMPSVFCVADDVVANALLRDKTASLELRFVLACCPRLTPADAADTEFVRRIVVQRRRQGRVRDWLAVLRPNHTEAKMLDELTW